MKSDSLFFTMLMLSGLAHSVTLLGFPGAEFSWLSPPPRNTARILELELVEEKPTHRLSDLSRIRTPLISDQDRKSQDRTVSRLKGPLPVLPGEGEDVKRTLWGETRSLPERTRASQAGAGKEGLSHETEAAFSVSRQTHRPSDQVLVHELRRKIRELVDLERKLVTEEQSAPSGEARSQEAVRKKRLFKKLESEAENVGDLSLATRKHVLVPYLERMRQKVFETWYPYVSLKYRDLESSKVMVEFKIMPNGEVRDVRVRYWDGTEFFRDFCMAAVASASPFDPLPVELPAYLAGRFLLVTFTFLYN